jgi:signal transduction histidine kinase
VNDLSTLQRALITLSNLLTVASASGLIFVVLVQPRRDRTNVLFAAFSASLALWGLFSLPVAAHELRFEINPDVLLYLLATAATLAALFFFLFAVRFSRPTTQLARGMTMAAPFLVAIGIVLVWAGLVFTPSDENFYTQLTTLGHVLVALIVVYMVMAFSFINSSDDDNVTILRIPTLLLVLAFAASAIDALNRLSLDTVLATIVALWTGWIMLRFQLFKPLEELNNELRTANRDLRQSVGELAAGRAQIDGLKRDLQAASGYKGEFLTNMSHKVRVPLNSIVGYSELLQSGIYGELTEKQLDRLEKIHRNGNMLLELINNMLDLTKIETGRLELNLTLLKLDILIAQVAAEAVAGRAEKGIELVLKLDAELPAILGDEKRIQQVFAQLLDNALKFTSKGQIILTAQAVTVQRGTSPTFKLPVLGWLSDGDWIVVGVADTGIGIAPEDQAKVFDEFYQADEKGAAEFGGTGLGLAICKKLVEMHNGVIWVRSAPEQGSTFFVALPSHRETKSVRTGESAAVR